MADKRKVLILGGEGFIGRNLSDVLSVSFDCISVGLNRSIFPGSKADFIASDPYCECIPGQYDIVIQLIDNQLELPEVEKAEKKLLSNLESVAPKHLVVFSSSVIYMSPDSEYAKRKLLIEGIYQNYCQNNNIDLTILRLFNIFGPYQLPGRKGGLVANLLYNYYLDEATPIDDLNAERDFIYSYDMAKCVDTAIKKRLTGVDDLAANKITAYGKLIEKINQILPSKIRITNNDKKEIIKCPNASSRIIKLIRPRPMRQSLAGTVDFYKNNWKLIKDHQDAKK